MICPAPVSGTGEDGQVFEAGPGLGHDEATGGGQVAGTARLLRKPQWAKYGQFRARATAWHRDTATQGFLRGALAPSET